MVPKVLSKVVAWMSDVNERHAVLTSVWGLEAAIAAESERPWVTA